MSSLRRAPRGACLARVPHIEKAPKTAGRNESLGETLGIPAQRRGGGGGWTRGRKNAHLDASCGRRATAIRLKEITVAAHQKTSNNMYCGGL